MARIHIIQPREQAAHFGLYRTSAGGDERVFVRRKVGEPTDVMHTKSRKLKRQREYLTLASQHYSRLSPTQKAITRHQIEEIDYTRSHGKTDTKILLGRQLFIAKEMRSLATTGKQLLLPHELCIMLVDQALYPLSGELWLRYFKDGEWLDCEKEELATGSWLFSQVPRGMSSYRVYGEAEGYIDPQLPEHQYMTEDEIRAYHYHQLYITAPFRSYSFYSRYWSVSYLFTAYVSSMGMHIHSELKTYDFTGDLIVGLKEPVDTSPPDEWIVYKTHPVSAGDPDPKHFYTTFIGYPLTEGKKRWLVHQLPGNAYNYWSGIVRFYELP